MIEIVSTLPLNTIQDGGRLGARHYGVSTSGVMDALAFEAANILLDNPGNAAVIEVQTFPFEVRFLADSAFAVTGCDAQALLDGRAIPPWWATHARRGQSLTLRPPRRGTRAYIALAGGVDVPVVLGSRSTHLRSGFGGFEGRALRPGDVVNCLSGGQVPEGGRGLLPPDIAIEGQAGGAVAQTLHLRVLRAGDYDVFPPDIQQRFWSTEWRISRHSDRAGYRLSGPPLQLPKPVELRSYGLVAGIIQVPPSGEPIIQLSDANTAGGYPKIAAVIDADLWSLAQARLGSMIRFVEVSHAEAIEAMAPLDAYLASARRMVELHRML